MRSLTSSATVPLRIGPLWAATCSLLVGSVFHAGLVNAAPPVATAARPPAPQSLIARPVAPTVPGGCAPNAGRILQQVCVDGVVNPNVLQFEDESIAAWLQSHEIPLNQASMLYQYGRSDLRSELRAWMLQRLVKIASTHEFFTSAHEEAVLAWFVSRVWAMEKTFWDKAVQLRDQYLANPCGFAVDPEIEAQTGMTYDPPFRCTNPDSLLTLFLTDPVLVQSYFRATALKIVSSEMLSAYPGGHAVLEQTIGNTALLAYSAAVFATTAAVFVTLGIAFYISVAIFSALAQILFAFLIPLLAVILAAIKFAQIMDDEKNRQQLMALDGERDKAHADAPDVAAMSGELDTSMRLIVALAEASLPDFSSTTPLPAQSVSDLPFLVTPDGGTSQTLGQFTWTDWDDDTWSAYAPGFWLAKTRDSDLEKSFGVSFRYRNWAGEPYSASRMGRRFLLTKRDPVESDKDCPQDTNTGLSTQTGSTCKAYVAGEIQLKDATGQNVTVALPADPAFLSPDYTGFRRLVPSQQSFTIQTTGSPLPTVALAPAATLPPGLSFANNPPRIVMAANSSLAAGTYTTTLRATNSAGFVDQLLTITIVAQLAITSPASTAIQLGVPFTFRVQGAGFPPLTLEKEGIWGPPAITFTDHGDGTATFSGTAVVTQQINCFVLPAGPCGIRVTESGGGTLVQEFSFTILPPPPASFRTPLEITMDRGIPNLVPISASNDATAVGISQPCGLADRPAWLALAESADGSPEQPGDGNVFLIGTPPAGTTEEEIEIYLHAKPYSMSIAEGTSSDAADCASNQFPKHKIRLLPRPHFTGPPDATIDAGDSYVVPTSMPPAQPVTVSGVLPPGVTFDSATRELSGPGQTDAGGIYSLVFRMENEHGSAEQPFELTVLEPPSLSSSSTINFTAGHANQHAVTALGFPRESMTFTPLSPLPAGFTFTQQGDIGILEGAPAPGTYLIPIRIENDDRPEFTTDVTITVNVVTAAVSVVATHALQTTEAGQTDSFTVSLSTQPADDVTVTVASTDLTEGTAGPTLTFTPEDFSSPKTVTITGVDDAIEDGNVAYNVTLTLTSTDPVYNGLVTPPVPVTNLDNDGDSDGDGVQDPLEDLAPNSGDGNGDGIPDRNQQSVVSIRSYPGGAMLTLTSSCPLSEVMVTDEQLVAPDPSYAYPFGLIAFRAACSSGTFSLFVHTPNPVPTTYRKYGPVPAGGPTSTWYTLPGATFSSVTVGSAPATRIDFALTDGALGDDTAVDGVIVDQGGPGDPTIPVPLFGPYGLLITTLLMAFAAAWVLARGRA